MEDENFFDKMRGMMRNGRIEDRRKQPNNIVSDAKSISNEQGNGFIEFLPGEYLLRVGVKRDGEVEQLLPLLHSGEKLLHPIFQLVRHLVDLLRVALARVGQLFRGGQQLVRVRHRVLDGRGRR